jgi:hypothetical protein
MALPTTFRTRFQTGVHIPLLSYTLLSLLVGDSVVPLGEVPGLTRMLAQTDTFLITSDAVNNSLRANTELENASDNVPGSASVDMKSGSPYLSISTVMGNPADVVAVSNAYADALAATDSYSSVKLGSLSVRLELVEPALTATVVAVVVPSKTMPSSVWVLLVGLCIGVTGVLFVE